jgi:hypothetical protein
LVKASEAKIKAAQLRIMSIDRFIKALNFVSIYTKIRPKESNGSGRHR